jgi:putative transposase
MFLMTDNKWARLLAYVTGLVNQKLLLQNEYLAAANRILRAHLPAPMRLSDPQRSPSLRSASDSAALLFSRSPVSPSQIPSSPGIGDSLPANSTAPNSVLHSGRPRVATEVEALIVRFTRENSGGLRYLLHDRDTKFSSAFLDVLRSSGI